MNSKNFNLKKLFLRLFYIILISNSYLIQSSYGQISKAKLLLNQLYFDVPTSPEKFDIRRIINRSENFYGYREPDTTRTSYVAINFEENKNMTFLGHENSMLIFFNPDGSFDQIAIKSIYEKNEISKCENQVEQILSKFKPISYKTSKIYNTNWENKMNGRGYSFFSSLKLFQKNQPYAQISYFENPDGFYEIDLHYFPTWLK